MRILFVIFCWQVLEVQKPRDSLCVIYEQHLKMFLNKGILEYTGFSILRILYPYVNVNLPKKFCCTISMAPLACQFMGGLEHRLSLGPSQLLIQKPVPAEVCSGMRWYGKWVDHRKGDEGELHVSLVLAFYLEHSLFKKSGFQVKGVKWFLAFRKNTYRYVKTSEEGRTFQMLSISLFPRTFGFFPS